MVAVRFFNMLIMMLCLHRHSGSLKINIFKVLFWEPEEGTEGRGHKKYDSVRF